MGLQPNMMSCGKMARGRNSPDDRGRRKLSRGDERAALARRPDLADQTDPVVDWDLGDAAESAVRHAKYLERLRLSAY